jgi:hypothetical protein
MSTSMQFACTFFRNYAATNKTHRKLTMPELASLIESTTAPTKIELPWLKLAYFGDTKTPRLQKADGKWIGGSLRHDKNVRWISGIEFDYDGEQIAFVDAVDILDCADVMSIVYTSPRYTDDTPRWRVLCPFSLGQPPDQRRRHLARLNGLFGGVVSHESWTLSQSYYFGSVNSNPSHRVETIYGHTIDQLDDLDARAIGPSATPRAANGDIVASGDAREDAELIRRIVTGEGLHPELCAMAARLIGRGLRPDCVVEHLRGFLLATPEDGRDERWHHRYGQIPGLVDTAVGKFPADDEKREAWKAVARVTHRMIKERQLVEDIIWQVSAVAQQNGLDVGRALTLADKICAEAAEAGNV